MPWNKQVSFCNEGARVEFQLALWADLVRMNHTLDQAPSSSQSTSRWTFLLLLVAVDMNGSHQLSSRTKHRWHLAIESSWRSTSPSKPQMFWNSWSHTWSRGCWCWEDEKTYRWVLCLLMSTWDLTKRTSRERHEPSLLLRRRLWQRLLVRRSLNCCCCSWCFRSNLEAISLCSITRGL